jgi:hypothetical protein
MTSDDRRSGRTRRSLLRVGGASALGAVTGSAGCLSTLPPLGKSVKYGRLDVPKPEPPRYREWLPDPELVGQDPDTVQVHQTQPRRWLEANPRPFGFHSVLVSQLDHYGIGYGDYDRIIWYGDNVVVLADFDPDTVGETLLESGFERAAATDRYDLFSRSDVERVVAVGSDALVTSRADRPREEVDAMYDARAGDVARFHEVDEEFDHVTRLAGDRLWTWRMGVSPNTNEFGDDLRDRIVSSTADDERVYLVYHYQLAEGATPSTAEVKRTLKDDHEAHTSQLTDIDIDGPTVIVEYNDPDSRFRVDAADPLETLPPQVTWGFDRDRAAETVTVRHEAGEPVDPARITVEVDLEAAAAQFEGSIEPGGALEVAAEPGDSVTVVWESADGDSKAMMARYDVEGER